jgi:phosphohistidine phosphatase
MKTLTLLRHAKSSWHDHVPRDFDRPLNKRGRKAARTIGREMRDQGLAFDAVIASPAVRVIETLDDVAEGYGHGLDPSYDKRVYLASPSTLLDVIHEVGDETGTLLIVGHNPGLEQLALLLTSETANGLRSEVEVKYPTATIAEIRLPVTRWSEVARGMGTIARFIRPRDLDPTLGPDEDTH